MHVTLFCRFGDALQPLRLFQVVLFGPNHQVQGQRGEFQKGEEAYHSMYNSVHLEFSNLICVYRTFVQMFSTNDRCLFRVTTTS